MYRAVKVVRREDFEYERTFEREFEGIQRYEKVSHEHPGLVDILHVGRDREAGFYYYVMELADDESGESVETGHETYRPRTLSSDLRRGKTHSVRECVDLGIAMGRALGHLHHAGLTHRDVKPSNIIIVKGHPKLADVGLVASTGQRTFVGTEGYVPPEGPGTSSADLYSLAMVLYEMHTGKDRLDFPELPTNLEISPSVNRDEWRALNSVICRAGSPDPRKRYDSAEHFARALETVCAVTWKAPETGRNFLPALFGTVAVLGLLAIVGFGGWWIWQDNQRFVEKHTPLLSDSGDRGINGAGLRTPIPVKPSATGVSGKTASGGGSEKGKPAESKPGKAPESGERAKSKAGAASESTSTGKSAAKSKEVEKTVPDEPKETPKPPMKGKGDGPEKPDPGAEEVAEKSKEESGESSKPLVAEVVVGHLKITSQPQAATVFHEGKEIGVTETKPMEFPVGAVELVLKREGFRDYHYRGVVRQGTAVVNAVLQRDLGPVEGQPWRDSLGIPFAATAEGGHRSVTEVTVEVFDRFNEETGSQIPRTGQKGIAYLSDPAAVWQFCDWLTEKDRASGYLGEKDYLRPARDPVDPGSQAFFLEVSQDFGLLVLNSDPEGARIYRGGDYLGETPAPLPLRLGPYHFLLYGDGHAVAEVEGELTAIEPVPLVVALEPDASVEFGKSWTNSQGMLLLPAGPLLVARTETPMRAYYEFVAEQGAALDPTVAAVEWDYPASGVSQPVAVAFCEWLTERERKSRWIRPWQRYRLPTDLEWSRLVGLVGEVGATPEERSASGAGTFPWGKEWPPPPGAGNFADLAASGRFGGRVIEGYSDGYESTAPVGSFGATPDGLHDLAGNLWEWVADPYNPTGDGLRVVRGGAWNAFQAEILASSYRNPVPAETADSAIGFRYVLEDLGVTE